jgi:hypothetical protein
MALVDVGRFREAVEYVQKAARALYEAARDVFERVKVTVQRLVELFVEAVARVLAWVDEHKAYLFLMAAVAAGVVALSAALNLWGLIELEKLAHAAVGMPPFVAGLADAGGKAAERFKALAERYERWRVDENVINEVINAPLNKERPYETLLRLAKSPNLPRPLVELRKALMNVKDEAEKDAAVIATLVLYKALINNAEAYGEWAEVYRWARGLVEKQEFTVAAGEVEKLREAQRRLEEVAEEVIEELNSVLALYASHSRDLYEKLRPHLEVDLGKAEELAEAGYKRLSDYSDASMGTKAYAALLSFARGGLYRHAAMLLVGEGALADVVLLTPGSAYNEAWEIAKGRGESVDPSRSGRRGRSVGQPSWEDRAASVLLRYLLSKAVSEDLQFRRVGEGFEVFRIYGGVEMRVDVLMVEGQPRSKAGEEVLRRFVEEAKETAPDLSGVKKIWHVLPWLNTDVSFNREWIVAATAHTWQAAWYIALFGEPESISGGANVTKKGVKPNVVMHWRREVLDSIIAAESDELKPLLGRSVKSWRELVDATDWSWVVERVRKLIGELKSWIGREDASDVEREGLARRMLGELELLAHFAETRRGKNDGEWREERVKRLTKAVEMLSGGKIAGEYAERLTKAIIYYAEGYKKKAEGLIESLAREVGVSREEARDVVNFVLSDMYCLARDCARDVVVRKFVEPALELIMLDKALNNEFDREKALLIFGEMYTTAVAGDGTVGPDEVKLTVGGELGGGVALLRLATLHLLNQLLSDELKFDVRVYVRNGSLYNIAATSENAARLMRFLAVTAPSAGGRYLSEKFEEFVKDARVEVRLDENSIRRTEKGRVAADLIISEAGVAVKYNVYLRRDDIMLQFRSTDRSRVELAAILLRHTGVDAKVKKEGNRDEWYVYAYTDMLAAGRKELRDAIAEIVKAARKNRWIDAGKAERWLKKLERGRVLKEGWPKYEVRLARSGALDIRYRSTSPNNIEQMAQRLKEVGLVGGRHFSVKMPEDGRYGYVSIRREGLAHAAWLSVHGEGERQRLAAEFIEYIVQRARETGEEVYEKVREVVEEGKARDSLTLRGFEKKVEVNGKEHVVKVISGGAEFGKGRSGKKLLRLRITAEVDGVKSDYTITYSRSGGDNAVEGRTTARADAPGGRRADAERFSALVKALTGKEPRIHEKSDGTVELICGMKHLKGFAHYAELADAIEKWLEETDQ